MISISIFSFLESSTIFLSVLLQTVLAKCKNAPDSFPPGRIKLESKGIFLVNRSICFSISLILVFKYPFRFFVFSKGFARLAPISKRSF
ncbi:MAG: hypothetical protein V1697_00315 [Candidatus Levyibacteriota bacterium]